MRRFLIPALALMTVAGAALAGVSYSWFAMPYGYQTGETADYCIYYVDCDGGGFEVVVANTGTKMADDVRVHLFDPSGERVWTSWKTDIPAGQMSFLKVSGSDACPDDVTGYTLKAKAKNLRGDNPKDNTFTFPGAGPVVE